MGIELTASEELETGPVYFRLDSFEESKLVDLSLILNQLYSKKNNGVCLGQLSERSVNIREKLNYYDLGRRLKFFPRLHRSEKEAMEDLPKFYPQGYKEKRQKEQELHLAVDKAVAYTRKDNNVKCMEEFLRRGGTDVQKVKKIQRRYQMELRKVRREISGLCRRNK